MHKIYSIVQHKTIDFIEKISGVAGRISYMLTLFLVFIVFGNVLLRYFFQISINWLLELEWHAFGLVFLLGAPVALLKNEHIRVDLFLPTFSALKQRMVNGFGHLFLLIPWCIVAITTTWKYASNAFYFKESSPNPGGLSAWYLIKYLVTISFVLLFLQGVAEILKLLRNRYEAEKSVQEEIPEVDTEDTGNVPSI